MIDFIKSLRPIVTALVFSFCGGFIFSTLKIPLPWMLGPLFMVGAAGVSGIPSLRVKEIRGGRQAGQLIIGCALGLYFTAEVTRQVIHFGGYIIAAAFFGIAFGAIGGSLMKRLAGTTSATAFFASLPGGAAEMAALAEKAGARFDQVALSHSIRVLIAVSVVPIGVTLFGSGGAETYAPSTNVFSVSGVMLLILLASGSAMLFRKAGIPNAWLLGPLAVSLFLTVNEMQLSSIPPVMSIAGQILIGCSLGSRFKPSLRAESRTLILGILASSAFTLLMSVLMGLLLAWTINESASTMVLAAAPGGLSEMCITAKILHLGVPLVTSFQVARLAIVLTFSLPAWKILQFIRSKIAA